MVNALWQYAREEFAPRAGQVFGGAEFALSVAIAAVVGIYGPGWPLAAIKPSDASMAMLTYAAIAFGFCVSGMALALTLPNQTFVKWLIEESVRGRRTSAYSDLLFVFSWTAISHWSLVLLSFVTLAVRGPIPVLLSLSDGAGWKCLVGALFGVAAYSLIQFLLMLITLTQVGSLYVGAAKREANRPKSRP